MLVGLLAETPAVKVGSLSPQPYFANFPYGVSTNRTKKLLQERFERFRK